ncbi:MAG: hypothetical protein BWK73_37695 [Thiothrix lacustris]|uniref:Sulfatase-modifying factor enzyme-like domain-containing protein n=1 Tax=Thiothrix lacustris TaxID=525917 RepID=A0A1Y1QEQ9_9GAMM|nr:MAG: hypothetical protein BWK73_37695 [Thiothrix lacustris]
MSGEKSPRPPSGKAAFSRADLLWGFLAVGEAQIPRLAELLGFEETEEADTEKEAIPPPANDSAKGNDDQRDDSRDMDETPRLPSTATSSSYYRIVEHHRDETHPATENAELTVPDWFTQASPTILQETATRIPAIHQVVPLHPPLLPWSRLLPLLQRVLGDNISGIQPDMPKLVQQVADREFIRQIPRKQRHSWAAAARVLIDINHNNFPYRRDFIHLRERLKDARGDEGLQVQYIHDEPGGYIARYEYGREVIEPWQLPEKGTPILILSDMGMQAGSRRELYGWLVFGQLLKVHGFRPTVLMPVAERNIDKRLLKYFDCMVWDRNSRLKQVKGTYQQEHDKQDHAETVDQLLRYFFTAVRVDSGLLRAVRQLLPSCYDIGHEACLWQHPAVNKDGDEWAWQASSKPRYLDDAKQQLAKLTTAQQGKLVELVGRYHALYPDELYFEAMYGLMLLCLPVPEEVRVATEKFMQDMVATYQQNPDDTLLDDWMKRHLARYDDPAIRQEHRYWLPFMAFARKHEASRSSTAEIKLPDNLSPAEREEVYRFINHTRQPESYVLRQVGEALELLPKQVVTQTTPADEWGKHASEGATLLTLHLSDTHILHNIHRDDQGKQRIVMLDLVAAGKQSFRFPSTGKHEFQIGRECFVVEVKPPQQQREPWMRRVTAGGNGLRAESLSGGEYYWHPPEWRSGEGMLRGFWYPQESVSLESLPWAGRVGRDSYGVYADAEIAKGVKQRFRWIEPTHFLMGSPEDEAGRYDRETQHPVTLTQGYWLADTACTQALWQAVTGKNPSKFKNANNPIEKISWDDIAIFLLQLNHQQLELKLRLPTEAEWENACLAGTSGAFNFKSELSLEKINYRGTWDDYNKWGAGALEQTADVKSYPPNSWGLFEMHGNVWEWCQDWFGDYPAEPVVDPQGAESGSHRVLRGGSWIAHGRYCRSAYRGRSDPAGRDDSSGFRLALGLELPLVRPVVSQQSVGTPAPETTSKKSKSLLDRAKDLFKK